jgi:hypothetical protein
MGERKKISISNSFSFYFPNNKKMWPAVYVPCAGNHGGEGCGEVVSPVQRPRAAGGGDVGDEKVGHGSARRRAPEVEIGSVGERGALCVEAAATTTAMSSSSSRSQEGPAAFSVNLAAAACLLLAFLRTAPPGVRSRSVRRAEAQKGRRRCPCCLIPLVPGPAP